MTAQATELPVIYSLIEDLGCWDEYHIWHRDYQEVKWSTEPIEGVDYAKSWRGAGCGVVHEPSKRLRTLAAKGCSPALIRRGMPEERTTMLREGQWLLDACDKRLKIPYEEDDLGASKLRAEEHDYLMAWLKTTHDPSMIADLVNPATWETSQ